MGRWMLACLCSCLAGAVLGAQTTVLNIGDVMTQREQQDTGVLSLTLAQRMALDEWLNRYTLRVLQLGLKSEPSAGAAPAVPRSPLPVSSCSPAIETRISGDIEGWDGDTLFKLDNGQIWQQASYAYTYFYAYRPEVTIYQTSSGCQMKVEGRSNSILVKRIK